jgi:hypothetical protein
MWNDSFSPTKTGRMTAAMVLAVCCALLIPVGLVDPAQSQRFPRCAFHQLTGLHCPGCGATRALHQGLRGRIAQAASANLLFVAAVPWLLYEFVSGCLFAARGRGMRSVKLSGAAAWGILVTICLFGIIRNIPVAPFEWLAP